MLNLLHRIHWSWATFTLFGVLILVLSSAGIAYAFTVGNTDGVWGTIDTNGATCDRWASGTGDGAGDVRDDWWNQTPPNTDENQVRYGGGWFGCSTSFANQSGFGFDGINGGITPAANTPFYLGKFTHYNNPISASNTFDYVNLTTTVPVTCNDNTTTTSFSFGTRFALDETSNDPPCEYPGSSECPDRVTITQPTSSTFTCPDGDYTVNILGFQPQNASDPNCADAYTGTTQTVFYTEESTDNVACLWAEITAPTANIAPVKTCADYNTADPYYTIVVTNSGPGSARQVQFTDAFPTGVVLGTGTALTYTSQLTTTSGTVNAGSCSRPLDSQTVTCQLLTSLPPTTVDAAAKWTVVIHVEAGDTLTFPSSNTVNASMATTDTNPGNNSSTCTSTEPTSATVSQPIASTLDQTIVVTWETFDETNIIGFDLYRATPDGERSLVDSRLADQGPGSVYEYFDLNVQPGVLYTYWLEVRTKYGIVKMEPTSALLLVNPLKIYLPTIHR